jgi:hypothetical protein
MAQLSLECPHCRTEKIGFAPRAAVLLKPGENNRLLFLHAAIMFRRSIEIATKIVNPRAAKGDDLKKRINDLPDDVATPAMKAWGQHIRLEGNDATHEIDEFSEKDAKDLHVFAEMFLTYAFTLPEMLRKAKEPPKA